MVDTLELLPSDWLNLEPLAFDTPPRLLSGPCRTVMSINNADVIKLLRSDRSSDTRALFFFYFFFFFFFFFIFFFFIKYLALFTPTIFPISTPTRTVRRPSPPQPALFAEVRTLPIFQHFSSKSLSFNMADLGLKYSDSTDFSTFFFKIPIF